MMLMSDAARPTLDDAHAADSGAARAESWYVYYPAPTQPDALPRLRAMQRTLEAAAGVRARLEARTDATRPTWMEVYENVADGAAFGVRLDGAVAALGITGLAQDRHVERFRPL
jgi:hypothetical protein